MWIVRVALNRPYTFVVVALLVFILSAVQLTRTPTDVFPNINIPVIAIAWQFTGLNPEEFEGRITFPYERGLTTLVDNIEHIESITISGESIIRVFLQPGASLDTANAQVTAISQSTLKQLPPGSVPPLIINYSASTVPILQLALSGNGLTESQLFDTAVNFLRPQLITVKGVAIPYPYGGKQRQMMVDLRPDLLQSKGLSPQDVLNTLNTQNLVVPSGTAKIGQFEYDIDVNASPETIQELGNIPLKVVGNSTIYLKDVANIRDGFTPQTNIARHDGHRGALVTILKNGNASTLEVVDGIRQKLPEIAPTLPPELQIQPLADQSIFVRAAISGVLREAIIAACLTGLMILLFLGSWRSTLIIAVSIPLSILTSIIILSALGETINIMTLGGLALAVGILVDDATVEVENINRNLDMGKEMVQAILDGAQQIAVPAFVSTICICIVFLPMFFLTGVAKFLFVPLAEAVCFAMLASYFWSRTIVPTMAKFLLRAQHHGERRSRNPLVLFQQAFERGFDKVRDLYRILLTMLIGSRVVFIPAFVLLCASAALLIPWLGQDFFPSTDNGQFILHMRAKTGTRIEETARLCDLVEGSIRRQIPEDLDTILDNIGLPYSTINTMHSTSGVVGAADADILVSLKEKHRPTEDYVREIRKGLAREFPGTTFYFQPADIVSQILNFGLPAPIDIQIDGTDLNGNRKVADEMLAQLKQIPGVADLRVQQEFDYPKFHVEIDRTKAAQAGFTTRDVATSMLNSLSGSFQTNPLFFLNKQNDVNYNLITQTPQYDIQSLQDLQNIPISGLTQSRPGILADVASISRTSEMQLISHYNIKRIIDIYGSVQDRDLGAVSRDINKIVAANRPHLPRGSFINVRGQIETMIGS
ncbi:MAG TPA: efflux RND transporter permease subunit, partial [Blastocatellia bacterium]